MEESHPTLIFFLILDFGKNSLKFNDEEFIILLKNMIIFKIYFESLSFSRSNAKCCTILSDVSMQKQFIEQNA